ncbi:lipocalin 3 [Cricetulus griseus]
MQVQLSSVKDHWMLYCDGELEGMSFAVTQLIGRDLKENLEALEEFKEFTQKKGLIPENLVVPEQMDQGKNYLTFVAVTEEFTIMDLENQSEGNTLIVVELHVEGGSMHVHFVSTDYNNLILYVRFEDNEVVNLWALLGR